jgi:DNA polymerase-2
MQCTRPWGPVGPVRKVRYVMTKRGLIPIELHPKDPDYAHYIEHQVRPVADAVLEILGRSFDQILSAQMSLF